MPWPDYEKIKWSPRGGGSPPSDRVGVWPENDQLHAFLIDLTGRYLSCVAGDLHSPVEFTYCLFVQRGQASGFLRLDVDGLIVVAGFDRQKTPREQISSVALRYAALSSSAAGVSFLPLITVGAAERYAYYITSPHGLRTVYPEMIRSALRFTADYLILPSCDDSLSAAVAYAKGIEDGSDPNSVLDIEPLLAALIASAPEETRAQTRREFGRGLRAMLQSSS
jgi:hypothetical protein